jgi:uncharacterized membrane protein
MHIARRRERKGAMADARFSKDEGQLWTALVWLLFLALASVLCGIVAWRYAIFRTDVDLGIFTQVVAGLGHGFSSTAEGGVNHLLVHWSPIIAIVWPALRIFGPVGLEYAQAVLVAATLFPIWGLARARFSASVAFALTLVAALYPILCANAVGDFHEMAFVPLLSATLVYALDRRRWTLAFAAALLLSATKEDQFVALAINGLLFAAMTRNERPAYRAGLIVCGIGIVTAALYFGVVHPALNPHVAYGSLKVFDWSGQSYGGSAVGAILAPRLSYVLFVLAPLAFLPLFSRYGLFLIPGFLEVLASHQPVTLAPGAHYSALLTGYALSAFVDGSSRIGAWKPLLAKGLLVAAAVVSIGVAVFASPMEYWYYLYRWPNAHDALLEKTLNGLPPRARVGAEDEVFSHLGLDPNASVNFSGQQWFVYDATHYSQHWHDVDEPMIRRLVADRAYSVVSDRDGIVVLRRAP